MAMSKQVPIGVILGKYSDEILCDVVPMVTHDGVTNRFSFIHKGQKVTLKPLSPREVSED
ncbi:hypothetical protein CR513_17239, partial [Mucuna pruriens]